MHAHVFSANIEGVASVLLGFEVDGHLTLSGTANYGVVFVALWDVDLRLVRVELELAEHAAVVESDDGVVECGC